MPTVNIYNNNSKNESLVQELSNDLRPFIAKKLSCGDRKLSEKEISIRIHSVAGKMIAEIEIEITAYSYKERVEKQDAICNEIRDYILQNNPKIKDTRVWLVLSELGHSWEE